MPIVKKEKRVQIKIVIDEDVLGELDEYVDFVNTFAPNSDSKVHKSHAIETAVRRLFEQDTDWKKQKKFKSDMSKLTDSELKHAEQVNDCVEDMQSDEVNFPDLEK